MALITEAFRLNYYSSKATVSLINLISRGIEEEANLLTHIDSKFSLESDYSTHLLMLIENQPPIIIDEQDIGEKTPVGSQDYLPLIGFDSYKIKKASGNISLSQVDKEELYPGEEPWTFDLKISYTLKSETKILRQKILEKIPSLEVVTEQKETNPIFCAARIRGDFADILGVYFRSNFGNYDDDRDVDSINTAVYLTNGLIHESAKRLSKFKVRVHQSIIDQVSNEDPSIPLVFLDRANGALEHPMYVEFSDRVCSEFGLVKGVEYCIFRDDDHLFVTVESPNTWCCISRIELARMSNSSGRINRKQISIALKEALNLKNNRSGLSISRLTNQMSKDKISGKEEVYSRLGICMKLGFSNTFLDKPTKKGGVWKISTKDSMSKMFDEIIPLLIHLCLARLDPNLRGQIKKSRVANNRARRKGMRKRTQRARLLIWGKDSIRYLSDSDGSSRSRHFVNSHVRRIELKNSSTITEYRKLRYPLTIEDGIQIGYRMIRGHYRGVGETINWDGSYRFGKSPNYYSAKSLRWLKWIEQNQQISIQHAEKGGELRIPISNGYIQVDGFCKETNTVYEFHGDVYHGNLEIFAPEDNCHPFDKDVTAKELYEKTILREQLIKSIGFNLVSIWENDWDKIEKSL